MKKKDLRVRVEEVGLVPVIRTSSAEDARFAIEEVARGGIPIIELTMTVPGAMQVIREVVRQVPGVIIGAGTVLDEKTAHLHLTQSEFQVRIDLGIGPGTCRFWTCDLTKEYVAINADYST